MAKHMKESPGIHLNLLCKTVSLQKQQMQILGEVIEKHKKEINDANVRLSSMEKIFGPQFVWKIESYSVWFSKIKKQIFRLELNFFVGEIQRFKNWQKNNNFLPNFLH
jgi:hypothetical protein